MPRQEEESKKVKIKGKKTVWYKPGDIVPASATLVGREKTLEGIEVKGLHGNAGRIIEIHSYLLMNLYEIEIEEEVWVAQGNPTRPAFENNELFDKTKE